jgi:hypothetical protein
MSSLLTPALPLLLLLLSQSAQTACPPTRGASEQRTAREAEQWREDLAFMVAEMRQRHPNLHHTLGRERFAAAIADLHERIPCLDRNEIIVGFMRLGAMIGDGHTRVEPRKDPKFAFPALPLKLYLFDDGLFIRAALPAYASLVGAEITAFDAVPTAQAIHRVGEISSRDNAMGPKLFAPLLLNMPDVLHALKLAPSREAALLTVRKDGHEWTVSIPAAQIDPLWPPDTDISLVTPEGWIDARGTAQPPLWLQSPLDYHRLVELPDRHAVYVQLNMVANEADQTLDTFGEAIAARVATTNPRSLVLDLRLNQGGNGDLRHAFVRALIRAEDEDTRLFVLTWRGTFSASQFILDDLDRLSRAIFIGEPASSKPSHYGDAYRMPLPNSGITVRTSVKWWQVEQNFEPWTYVDEWTPLRFADYVAGRDPALEAALNYQPSRGLPELLLASADSAAVLSAIETYATDPRNRYANQAQQTLSAAAALARAKRTDDALRVAEFAVAQFPDNHDVHLRHALIAEQAGKFDIAAAAVSRALAIDPNSRTGRSLLERLANGPNR